MIVEIHQDPTLITGAPMLFDPGCPVKSSLWRSGFRAAAEFRGATPKAQSIHQLMLVLGLGTTGKRSLLSVV